jgi:hypothetical protein
MYYDNSSTKSIDSQNGTLVAGMIAGTTVFGIMALTAPFVFLPSKSSIVLPYMATPAAKLKNALTFLQQRQSAAKSSSGTTSSRSFLDLGSGDGEAVYQAVQIMQGDRSPVYQKATGIELNPTLFIISSIRRLFWTADQKSRSSFECLDFWSQVAHNRIAHADTILIFGVQPLMLPLSKTLASTCRPGTFILSYRFQLPIEDVLNTMDTHQQPNRCPSPTGLLQAEVIYDKEEMRIYQCKGIEST